ncbi:unnamed protein product [Alopecurus aequalis]
MTRRHTSPAAVPLDDEDLLAEILLRLPSNPSSLPRSSLVRKGWRSIATDAAFCRRFRTHHRKPPILGVFKRDNNHREVDLVFTSVLDPPDRLPTERFSLRPGGDDGARLVLFHPLSGDRRTMAIPPEFADSGYLVHNGDVLCAAGDDQDHVHGDCHSTPFKVVLVGSRPGGMPHRAVAAVYSSETGMWGDLLMATQACAGIVTGHPCTIIGNAMYWCLNGNGDGILEFDLDKHSLTVIDRPPAAPVRTNSWIIRGEDGGVGIALLSYPDLQLWDRKVNRDGAATWVLRKTACMKGMLASEPASANIRGYDEDTDAIFMSMHRDPDSNNLAIVQLESMRVKECQGSFLDGFYLPFADFYTHSTVRA